MLLTNLPFKIIWLVFLSVSFKLESLSNSTLFQTRISFKLESLSNSNLFQSKAFKKQFHLKEAWPQKRINPKCSQLSLFFWSRSLRQQHTIHSSVLKVPARYYEKKGATNSSATRHARMDTRSRRSCSVAVGRLVSRCARAKESLPI